ncbi:hypothetical protein ACFFX0_27660 [Citricoccus parietis]|uniref:Uncharacterized protein n=1 Tax=Citricoccus parietis TaxID=592307 RepID=A0ABV5G734_9MICC
MPCHLCVTPLYGALLDRLPAAACQVQPVSSRYRGVWESSDEKSGPRGRPTKALRSFPSMDG